MNLKKKRVVVASLLLFGSTSFQGEKVVYQYSRLVNAIIKS